MEDLFVNVAQPLGGRSHRFKFTWVFVPLQRATDEMFPHEQYLTYPHMKGERACGFASTIASTSAMTMDVVPAARRVVLAWSHDRAWNDLTHA